MANVAWPDVLKPSGGGFSHLDFDRSGGVGLGGGEQFVFSPGARWGAEFKFPIRNRDQVLAVRALRSQLQGKANAAILPFFDGQRANWPIETGTGRILTPRIAKYLEGTLGLDGTPYAPADVPNAAKILATVQTAAAINATQMIIAMTQGAPINAGQQFGIGQRLYEIASVDLVAGANTTVTFKPPLRAAAAAGATVLFDRAVCLMRCLNLDDQTKSLDVFRYAELDLQFVEYF